MSFEPNRYIADKVLQVPPSGIRKFFDLVAASKDVISLGVGEPDFVSPWTIREAAVYSLGCGYTMYTSNYGTPELRYEIARYLYERFGLEYDEKQEVMVTVGASEGIDLALRTLLEPGDEVLIPEPCYVSYSACTTLADGVPVAVPLSAENGFRLTVQDLEDKVSHRTKALILSFPNNPTGAVMSAEELQPIAAFAAAHDLIVISDEIYAELTYEGELCSVASLPGMKERTILVSGMSKAFAMTGWRIGYLACHRDFIKAMIKIHQYSMLCAPIMGQMAAVEAFKTGWDEVARMREEYNYRRRYIIERSQEIGLPLMAPGGAFYVFPRISQTGMDSETFAEGLLHEKRVAVVPGNAFGVSGEGFIRCSYATSFSQIVEAFARIDAFLHENA